MKDTDKGLTSHIEEHYVSGEYWEKHKDSESGFKVKLVVSILRNYNILLSSGLKIAEVGCGPGAFLFPLAEYLFIKKISCELLGYDISPQAINLANKRNKYNNVSFHIGSAEDIPEKLDYIFCMDVLEHIENPFQFLRNLSGKSNFVLLHLPIEHSLGHMLMKKPTKSHKTFKHIHFYSWETANLLLAESPFEIIGFQFTAASTELLNMPANPTLILLRKIRYIIYRLNIKMAANIGGGSVLFLLRNTRRKNAGTMETSRDK